MAMSSSTYLFLYHSSVIDTTSIFFKFIKCKIVQVKLLESENYRTHCFTDYLMSDL